MSKAVVNEILEKNLVEQCVSSSSHTIPHLLLITDLSLLKARVGKVLFAELEKLALKYPDLMMNLRGKGQG